MAQIVNRRIADSIVLSTLADNAVLTHDDISEVLLYKAFLFEYRMRGVISSQELGEWQINGGIQICLVGKDLGANGGLLNSILNGTQITDESKHIEVPTRQQLFGVADIVWDSFDNATLNAEGHFDLIFKPRSKGGIPFTEGDGWMVVVINRFGASLTAGNIVGASHIYERFAYEGGS